MRVWSCTLNDKLCRVSSSSLENMVKEDNQSLYNENIENNENNRVRTVTPHLTSKILSALGPTGPHGFVLAEIGRAHV